MRRRRLQLAILLASMPFASACGSAGLRDALSLDPVASAATKTEAVQSVRVAFDGSVSGPWAGQQVTFTGTGIVDGAAGAGQMHFTFDFPPAARAQLGANPTMDMIFDARHGLVAYMRSPMFARVVPDAKPWLKMDLAKIAALHGADLQGLEQLRQADPSQNLRFLTGAGGSRELGWDRVRGTLTKHYALTIDFGRFAKEYPQFRKALKQLRGFPTKLPAEAWIDDQGFLRKFALHFSLANSQDGPTRMSLSEEFYDFGVRAHVEAPPASQVTDATKLLGGR